MKLNTIECGHATNILKEIESDSVDEIITSPPYYGLRDYHTVDQVWNDNWSGELGQEPVADMYVQHLMEIFDEVQRVLKKTGTCFVVISDSYASGGGRATEPSFRREKDINTGSYPDFPAKAKLRHKMGKSLLMVPEKFAMAMLDHGWILRNKIVWTKNNPMPSPTRDRFTNSWEYIYFFVKNNKTSYWINPKLLKVTGVEPLGVEGEEHVDWEWKKNTKGELRKTSNWMSYDYFFKTLYQPYAESTLKEFTELYNGKNLKDYKNNKAQSASDVKRRMIAKKFPLFGGNKGAGGDNATYSGREWVMSLLGSKKRDVFQINTQPFPDAHFAVFPIKLITPLIDCGSPKLLCRRCNLPQVEVFNEFRVDTRPGLSKKDSKSGTDVDPNQALHISELSKKRQMIIHEPKAEIATCDCGAGFKKSVILDPFAGACTTAICAEQQKRNWVMIELNESYVNMGERRLKVL